LRKQTTTGTYVAILFFEKPQRHKVHKGKEEEKNKTMLKG